MYCTSALSPVVLSPVVNDMDTLVLPERAKCSLDIIYMFVNTGDYLGM